ncbi:MAG: MaoC family dehydratase N-terminal domain-containing protein [Chloroflexota bacterium]
MPEQPKVEFSQLEPGYEFPPASYRLEPAAVATYLKAVEDSNRYGDGGLVPPTAIAAYAMAALGEAISLPPGTIHISQELDFINATNIGDTITSYAKVSRKQERGRLHLLTVTLDVRNQGGQPVLAGRTGFILPQPAEDS